MAWINYLSSSSLFRGARLWAVSNHGDGKSFRQYDARWTALKLYNRCFRYRAQSFERTKRLYSFAKPVSPNSISDGWTPLPPRAVETYKWVGNEQIDYADPGFRFSDPVNINIGGIVLPDWPFFCSCVINKYSFFNIFELYQNIVKK